MDEEIARLAALRGDSDGLAIDGAAAFVARLEAETIRQGRDQHYGAELLREIDPGAQVYETAIYPSTPDDPFAWIATLATAPQAARVRALLRIWE